MSELIETPNERLDALYRFAHKLIEGENGRMLIETYKPFIDKVTATDAMMVFDRLLIEDYPFEKVKANVGKLINVFYTSLASHNWEKPQKGHFVYYLMLENRAVEQLVAEVRPHIKSLFNKANQNTAPDILKLKAFISNLKAYELHYVKKENILFPYLEKTFPQYRCLQLMWSFHDDFRKSLKTLEAQLNQEVPNLSVINIELGRLFFVVLPIIFREEQIVFPVALRAIPASAWAEMLEQSAEIGWCYGVLPDYSKNKTSQIPAFLDAVNLGTGFLKPEQLVLMLNHLPVDITFVDENDEVCYFSGGEHRIFPRSNAIIGRKVQNCHPPESVHVVNEIVEAFKNGTKDHADFWIQMKGRFIHIRYFALRNNNGHYKGTIEVSQDATEIRALSGEQRLLDWNK